MDEKPTSDYLTVGRDKDTGMWHGMMFRNKPTPSGCDRFILSTSTTQGFDAPEDAAALIEHAFPDLPKIDLSGVEQK